MKNVKKSILLPAVALGGGAVGFCLRLWQLSSRDSEGLLRTGHPGGILLLVLSAAVTAGLLLLTRRTGGRGRYYDNFPASKVGGAGAFVAAAGLFLAMLQELIAKPDALTVVCDLLGLAAAYCLAFTGYCRFQHRRPSFLFHTVVCVFFALRLISRYRIWSGNPQTALYAWELLAAVCLMLSAYQRAAFDLNMGRRSAMQFFSLMSVYFCLVALGGTESKLFYGAMGIWQATNLCTMDPLPPDPAPGNQDATQGQP